MAFTLKKVISFFLMPLSIIAVLFFIGLYFFWTKRYNRANVVLVTTFLLFLLVGFAPFSNMLVKPLENQYQQVETYDENIKYILLLGGNFKTRGYEALRLYHQHENIKIITSGYGGYNPMSDAQSAALKLIDVGVPKEDILVEAKSQDTHEEALMMKQYVQDRPFYLVTSALHMPRAMLLFEQEGLTPIAAPTDFIEVEHLGMLKLFNANNILITQRAMHEYIGIVYTQIKEGIKTLKGFL